MVVFGGLGGSPSSLINVVEDPREIGLEIECMIYAIIFRVSKKSKLIGGSCTSMCLPTFEPQIPWMSTCPILLNAPEHGSKDSFHNHAGSCAFSAIINICVLKCLASSNHGGCTFH